MNKVYEVCSNCTEKHCCGGICKEMNDYLAAKRKNDKKKNK